MRSSVMHYENGKGYDVIDFAADYGLNFNRGNVLKYITRAGRKEDEVKDLEKAMDYLQREIAIVRAQRDAETEKIKNSEVIVKYVNG
jgi:hypothetical protein